MAEKCNCPDDCPAHSGVEADMSHIKAFLEKLETNHLAHIYSRLNSNQRLLIGLLVAIIGSLFLLVINLIVLYFTRKTA